MAVHQKKFPQKYSEQNDIKVENLSFYCFWNPITGERIFGLLVSQNIYKMSLFVFQIPYSK